MFVSDKLARFWVAITTGSCMHTQVPYTYTDQLLSSLWSALSSIENMSQTNLVPRLLISQISLADEPDCVFHTVLNHCW